MQVAMAMTIVTPQRTVALTHRLLSCYSKQLLAILRLRIGGFDPSEVLISMRSKSFKLQCIPAQLGSRRILIPYRKSQYDWWYSALGRICFAEVAPLDPYLWSPGSLKGRCHCGCFLYCVCPRDVGGISISIHLIMHSYVFISGISSLS